MFCKFLSFRLILICGLFISIHSFCQAPIERLTKITEDEFKAIKNVIETKLSKWKEFSQGKDPGFDLNSFEFQWTSTLNRWDDYHFPKKDDNVLDSVYYYCFSPDSTKYVDIYSSHAHLDSVNGSIQATFEVDSDAHLIDLIKRKILSVLIFGTNGSLDDIAWIDNSSFVIVGYGYLEPVRYNLPLRCNAFIYYISLEENTLKLYRSTRSLNRQPGYYNYKFPEFVKYNH